MHARSPAIVEPPAFCGIAIMAKASRAGLVKTRLSRAVPAIDAARVNTAFLKDVSRNLAAACSLESIKGYVAFGPPGAEAAFDFLPEEIDLFEAWELDFGETLKRAITTQLKAGHGAAGVLNSDSPTLPTSVLVDTARKLAEPGERIVLGPSNDGGYYLLGMQQMHARLFEDIDWSTERVAAQTLDRAREIGLEVHLLPEWYDVDDAKSFAILCAELFDNRPFQNSSLPPSPAPHTRALLSELLAKKIVLTARPTA